MFVHELPGRGETVTAYDAMERCGGKGANQAVASALCAGAETALISSIGDDAAGRRMLAHLTGLGVRPEIATVHGLRTGSAVVVVGDDGENQIIVSPGANQAVTVGSDSAAMMLATAAVLLLQLEIPLETAITAARHVKGSNPAAVVILNASPTRDVPDELLMNVDLLIVNEPEAYALTGIGLTAHVERVLAALVDKVPECVITRGSRGSVFGARSQQAVHVPALPAQAVDTTGAGDTFCGALAGRIALGHDRIEALRFAAAAAALSVQERGAQAGMRSANEVARHAAEYFSDRGSSFA